MVAVYIVSLRKIKEGHVRKSCIKTVNSLVKILKTEMTYLFAIFINEGKVKLLVLSDLLVGSKIKVKILI